MQLCAVSEPLFPNLKTLELFSVAGKSIPFIPLFLSPRTTIIRLRFIRPESPTAMVAPMVATFPILCPSLQEIRLNYLPMDPAIVAAVSGMLIASNRNTLRSVIVDSPLTEEAHEAIFKLPNLRDLSLIIERGTPLPSMVLPNLTDLVIGYDRDCDWLPMFQEATLGKLEAVTFNHKAEQIGDFLEAFERVTLGSSVQDTLRQFYLHTSCSWNPNYSSLLPFTQLKDLIIGFSCDDSCSSRVDDDIIMNLARTMPKLETLQLGGEPCSEIPIGVTVKGLVVLANHCPNLLTLTIHFQVASFSAPAAIHGMTANVGSTALRRDCTLENLIVGEIPMPEESVLMVAVTLARIFPHLDYIYYTDQDWEHVVDAIRISRQIIDYSGKPPLYTSKRLW